MKELSAGNSLNDRGRSIGSLRFLDGPVFRLLIFPMMFACTVVWLLLASRLLSVPILILVIVMYFLGSVRCRTGRVVAAWLLLIGSTLLPIDVSFRNYPGPPRFVPLVMGRPTQAAVERAERGEVMLGGCITSGYEPEWVWVW